MLCVKSVYWYNWYILAVRINTQIPNDSISELRKIGLIDLVQTGHFVNSGYINIGNSVQSDRIGQTVRPMFFAELFMETAHLN